MDVVIQNLFSQNKQQHEANWLVVDEEVEKLCLVIYRNKKDSKVFEFFLKQQERVKEKHEDFRFLCEIFNECYNNYKNFVEKAIKGKITIEEAEEVFKNCTKEVIESELINWNGESNETLKRRAAQVKSLLDPNI